MIEYYKGFFGLNLLFRIHGSAIIRACLPGLLSLGLFYIFRYVYDPRYGNKVRHLGHPYAVGVLMTGVSFLIVFRANYGYQRYWEAFTAVHHMMSKWLDATVHTAAFHMQCAHYSEIKPPNFFDRPELLRGRYSVDRGYSHSRNRRGCRSINEIGDDSKWGRLKSDDSVNPAKTIVGEGRIDGGWGLLFEDRVLYPETVPDTNEKHISWARKVTPSIFLQELAHLSSLAIAMAFCTLRGDAEGTSPPLATYSPGLPWPDADAGFVESSKQFFRHVSSLFGIHKQENERTVYNAARPMLVLGAVSENEVNSLKKARGASAKTELAWYWLSEFVTREHLMGCTGDVGPPIISRIHQFLSDGMIYYNHARKIMYIPFPFPHAQISAFSILVMVIYVPFLMEQYSTQNWVGASLTFFTVVCLAGLHEVARELENPFWNVPNDVPLQTLLAMYNESLVSMCTGYHPDHYWRNSDLMVVDSEDDSDVVVVDDENGEKTPQEEAMQPAKDPPVETKKEVPLEDRFLQLEEMLKQYDKELDELRTWTKPAK